MRYLKSAVFVVLAGIVSAAGCGQEVPSVAQAPLTTSASSQRANPATSESAPPTSANALATTTSSSAPPMASSASCPAWVVRDVTKAAQTTLPVPTTQFQEYVGIAQTNAKTLTAWWGEPTGTPISAALNGWHWLSTTRASHGSAMATLKTSAYGDTVVIDETRPTPWQVTTIKAAGWPAPSPSQPLELEFSVTASHRTIHAAMQALVQTPPSGIIAVFPQTTPNPPGYETYAGAFPIKNLLSGPSCRPTPSTATWIANGLLTTKQFWMVTQENGITIGFAPGHVVVASGHAGIVNTAWYREPSIATPPFPTR